MRFRFLAAGLAGATLFAGAGLAAEVNLYSSRHYDTDEALYGNFTKATGIKVNRIEADGDALIERMKAEGDKSPADVLITVDAGRLWRAKEAGVLQPIQSARLEQVIPAHLRDPDGAWFGLSKRARVLAYSRERVKPAQLSTYEDLADPKWKDKVLVRTSNHTYNQSLVGSLIAALGPEKTEAWAKGLVGNFARPPKGGDTDQIKAVAAGEGDIAIVNHYYYAKLLESTKPADKAVVEKVGVHFPNQQSRGTHVNISGAGVAKHAPNKEAAVKFIEYLASPEAQLYFAQGNNEYPVAKNVKIDAEVALLGEFKEDRLSAATYGKNNPEALRIMDRAGWK